MKRSPLSIWTLVAIVVTVIAGLAMSALPLGAGADATIWPNFLLCVVFFWLVHRPLGLPTLAVLFTGLIDDLIGGGVLGAGMLALLIGSLMIRSGSESLVRSAFGLRWLTFAAFAAVVFFIEWMLTSLPRWSPLPIGVPFAQFLVTVIAYAPVSVLFRKVLRIGRT